MSGQGQDNRSPEEHERAAEMDAEIIRLRRQRISFAEIGRRLAPKYRQHGDADQPFDRKYMHHRYHAALKAVPAREIAAHREELNQLLEELVDQVNEIMRRDHVAHSQGRIVREEDGTPVLDDGPKIAAASELRKIVAEIRTLNGLTVPVKQELGLDATVAYTINGVSIDKLT
jgi:hypothetical protein